MFIIEFQMEHHLAPGLTVQQTIMQAASKQSTEMLRNLALTLGVSDRIFQWTCLRAKANLQAWGEIQAIFQTKVEITIIDFKNIIQNERHELNSYDFICSPG